MTNLYILSSPESTEVIDGAENIEIKSSGALPAIKEQLDGCFDHTDPAGLVTIENRWRNINDVAKRGVRMRYLTEITKDNVQYCKEMMKIGIELRHLDGVKGNFGIADRREYITILLQVEGKPPTQALVTNVRSFVEQQQYFFDMLWKKSISAEKRIRDLDQGISTHYETKIIEDPDEIVREIGLLTANSNELSTCLTSGGMQYSYNHFFDIKKKLLEKQKQGEHKGVRYISNIDKDDVKLAKMFLDAGIHIRHVKNLPPVSFGVSDNQIAATIEKMEGGRMVQSLLLSNEPAYVNHFYSIFEELWKNGIDAKERINDIEAGAHMADIEVIQSSLRAKELYLKLVKKAEEEIIIMFPTTNAFIRQKNMGVIQFSEEAAGRRNVKVRMLMPSHQSTEEVVYHLKENYPESVDVRYIEKMSDTKATILVVDRKVSLVMELRDDSKQTFDEAIGLSTYSNSRPGVLSYVSIFDSLWEQTELYEQLKHHDIMQKGFINIAAHELKTPIQPILGLTEVLRSQIKDPKQQQLLEVTIRNAKRLQRLTNDILDVTKIEGRSLELNKENFNINDVVINAMNDVTLGGDILKRENIKLSYNPHQNFSVYADKERISQVISNLLSNAIKFTKEGTILVSVEQQETRNNNNNNKNVLVSVKDSGQGIGSSILPRLFTRFVTSSHKGTGLGLFISKGIIEAHGGNISGENNPDGRGATFSFSLPTN